MESKEDFDAYSDNVMEYEYDLGAGWEHSFTLMGRAPMDRTIVCLAGEGNGPPEHCAGTNGFEEFKMEVGHELDEGYDPHEWDIQLVNQGLDEIEWVIEHYRQLEREEMEEQYH
jgi:hypothetical protein